MEAYFTDLMDSMASYFRAFRSGALDHWWVLPIALLVGYLISRALLTRPVKPHASREQHVLKQVASAYWIAALLLTIAYSYLWGTTDYYSRFHNQLVHLLTLVAVLLIPLIAMLTWRLRFGKRFPSNISQQSLTRLEFESRVSTARKGFHTHKWWSLLPLSGLLLTALAIYQPHNLVSIVIDNSSSMNDEVEIGKRALTQTIRELDSKTHLVITWFTEDEPKTSANDILRATDPNMLEGQHAFFTHKESAIDHLYQISAMGGTPLLESTWGNLLFARTQQGFNYDQKTLLLITDGQDSYVNEESASSETQFFCDQPDFEQFYDRVAWINLGGDLFGPFYEQMIHCGYYIEEDAADEFSYRSALDHMLSEFKRDWFFIIWLAIVTVLMALIAFTLQPKRI